MDFGFVLSVSVSALIYGSSGLCTVSVRGTEAKQRHVKKKGVIPNDC